jgi:hypothetical protein
MIRRPTPTRPPRTPPARLSDAEVEAALRRAFDPGDDLELWVVPTALLAKIARSVRSSRKEAAKATGP